MKKVLITGGAGFVGSSLAIKLSETRPDLQITALDNLKRRGSELALPRLKEAGIAFVHGDIRVKSDLDTLGDIDTVLDCAAEPSVLAGVTGSPQYVLDTNLAGTLNTLEFCRQRSCRILFLSTSRVYPYSTLSQLPIGETEDRFVLEEEGRYPAGASKLGIAEDFALNGAKTLYGATKLASELFIQEYSATYGISAVINRCGVLTGPWQMGKVDQGFVVLWLSRHLFNLPLRYLGFGGSGKQVRDILDIADLFDLVSLQLQDFQSFQGGIWNVGGGPERSISLRELTNWCQARFKTEVPIDRVTESRPGDLPVFITNSRQIEQHCAWKPKRSLDDTLTSVADWLEANNQILRFVLE